eukprot:GHVU01234692.1.p2 GENE.GHVU01234692.1~~GHVU01234692.1.p2  ORF type:complete len:110 (-),score=7.03 GHVU01234692.1:66-395(-)
MPFPLRSAPMQPPTKAKTKSNRNLRLPLQRSRNKQPVHYTFFLGDSLSISILTLNIRSHQAPCGSQSDARQLNAHLLPIITTTSLSRTQTGRAGPARMGSSHPSIAQTG